MFLLLNFLNESSKKEDFNELKVKVKKKKYDDGKGLYLRFYDKNIYIGTISTARYKNFDNNLIHAFEVEEKFRNKGYGTRILKYTLEKYHSQYLYVNIKNDIAINLYKKFGFKVIETIKNKNSTFYFMYRPYNKGEVSYNE